jgi:hypothetical protein
MLHTQTAAGGQAADKREQRTENRGRPKPQQLRHSLPLAIARYFAAPSIISAYQKHRLRFRRRAGHRKQDSGPPGEHQQPELDKRLKRKGVNSSQSACETGEQLNEPLPELDRTDPAGKLTNDKDISTLMPQYSLLQQRSRRASTLSLAGG